MAAPALKTFSDPLFYEGTGRICRELTPAIKKAWSHYQYAINWNGEPLPVQFYSASYKAAGDILEASRMGEEEVGPEEIAWAEGILNGKHRADYISTTIMNEATHTLTCWSLAFKITENMTTDEYKTSGLLDWGKIAARLDAGAPRIFRRISYAMRSKEGSDVWILICISPFELGRPSSKNIEARALSVSERIKRLLNFYGIGAVHDDKGLDYYVPNINNPEIVIDSDFEGVSRERAQSRRDRVISDLDGALREHEAFRYVSKSLLAERGELLYPDRRVEKKLAVIYKERASAQEPRVFSFGELITLSGLSEDTLRRVLSNPPSWLKAERMKRGVYSVSVVRSAKLDDRLSEMESGPRYTFNLAWPEHVKDGQRYTWIGRLTAHIKQHGIDIAVARKAIPEIVRRVPGWEQSKNLTTNLQSIIGSIYGNRSTGAANTFATRKGPMVHWVEAALRKHLQTIDTNTPTNLNPKTTYKKGIPAECSFIPGAPVDGDAVLLPSSGAGSLFPALEASPRDGGDEVGGKGASPSPNPVRASTKLGSVPPLSLDLDGLFSSITQQLPALVKESPRFAHRWASSGAGVLASIRAGEWMPAPVKFDRKEKPDGGFRETVRINPVDKILHRAFANLIRHHFDGSFSSRSFAYRPGKSTLSALEMARSVALNSPWVLSLDITKCFDSIDQERLLGILSERITDQALLSFIRALLSSSKVNGLGLLQGSPASNVLSNVYLDRLDKWLEARGVEFARYADDVRVFAKSKLEAESLLSDVRRFLGDELGLALNEKKTAVTRAEAARFVGQPILISTGAFSDALRTSTSIPTEQRGKIMEGLMATDGAARVKYMLDWFAVLTK
jgi:hypothetical protein